MKIVIVEDNIVLAKSIEKVLTHEGHSVRSFADGLRARAFCVVEKRAIDCIIVDYMLPEIDGVTLIEELRHEGVTTPVLMLTARGNVSDKVRGLTSGADYYLTKPFEFDELIACINALHRRPNRYHESGVIEVIPHVHFDALAHTVMVHGEEVRLTPTESAIFAYLLRHRGSIVSAQELSECVFDFAKEHWSNSLEVHIKNLRKKLSHNIHEKLIVTVRGAGYRITT